MNEQKRNIRSYEIPETCGGLGGLAGLAGSGYVLYLFIQGAIDNGYKPSVDIVLPALIGIIVVWLSAGIGCGLGFGVGCGVEKVAQCIHPEAGTVPQI